MYRVPKTIYYLRELAKFTYRECYFWVGITTLTFELIDKLVISRYKNRQGEFIGNGFLCHLK